MDAIGTVEVETSGVRHFPDSGFLPRWLQVVLGSVARDAVISLIQGFYSTASGCPRAPPKVSCRFAVILGTSSGFSGFPIFRNLKDGPRGSHFPFLPQGHFRKRKDGPRATGGFASRAFSPLTKTDLGVVLKDKLSFRTASRRTSGVAKCRTSIWLPLQMDLGGVHFSGFPIFGVSQGWASGIRRICLKGHFRRIARTDLGLLTDLPKGIFVTHQDRPRGCPKENLSFGYPSGQTSGVTFPQIGILRPPSGFPCAQGPQDKYLQITYR